MRNEKYVVGFLGLGNIGGAVYEILKKRFDNKFIVKYALVKDLKKNRNVPKEILTDDPNDILNDSEIDVVVEFMGGIEPAWKYMNTALENGKNVVTANKAALAARWKELNETAKNADKGLYFEATCCAGIPLISALKNSLQANEISQFLGIVNGSTNYILSKMSDEKLSYSDALDLASANGYTEPDPSADVNGDDAVNKLAILLSLATHTKISVEDIFVEGMTNLDIKDIKCGEEMGLSLKFLAIGKCKDKHIEARVHPTFIPFFNPLASVKDNYNAVMLTGDVLGDVMFYGLGAGRYPTASAVVSDIINATSTPNGMHDSYDQEVARKGNITINEDWKSEYFLRINVLDTPGMLARVADIFGKCNVSIAKVVQIESDYNNYIPVVFLTHLTLESNMQNVMKILDSSKDCKRGCLIRIERN